MRLRVLTPGLVAFVLGVVLAGCGGASTVAARSSSGGGMPSGADEVPAAVPGFVTVDTTFGDQWDALNALLDKFPGKDQLLASIQKSLAQDGIDFDKDVKQTIGPELDLALFDVSGSSAKVVGLTQPKDKSGFEAALQKGAAPHPVYEESGGWVLFADTQATLDAYGKLTGDKLSASSDFKDALGMLPGGALARAYVDAAAIEKTAASRLKLATSGTTLRWFAAAAEAEKDGIRVDGYLRTDGGNATNFDSSLLDKVPAGAVAAIAYDGKTLGLNDQLSQLGSSAGQVGQGVAQIEAVTGVKLGDVVAALDGHGVLYVRAASPIPEVTLLEQGIDLDKAVQTLDALAAKLGALTQTAPKTVTVAGETVRRLTIQGITITYGKVGDMLVVTSGANTIEDLKSGGSSLTSSDEFKAAQQASGISGDTSGLLYVDVPDAVSLVETLARLTGNASKLPAEVTQNADHVRSVYVAAHADDKDTTHAVVFVHVQ